MAIRLNAQFKQKGRQQPEPHASPVEAIEDIQAQTHLHFFKNCRLTRQVKKVKAATDEGFSVRSLKANPRTAEKQESANEQEPAEKPMFEDANSQARFEEGKTMVCRIPEKGVVKSCRGTVQLLVQRNGRTMKPRYNQCGLLIGVEMSDGWELVYMPKRNRWVIFNHDGTTPLPLKITSVAFDQKGNLWYITADGQKTIFYTDGSCKTV